ncbi:MAG: hypothetical protein D6701_06285 [Gemmatimonadetes bacterium]|nr:MAG: hypothetical protein D6701_06285 [Gemmatimonadota bacterium]
MVLWTLACTAGWGVGAPLTIAALPEGDAVVRGLGGLAGGALLSALLQLPLVRGGGVRGASWIGAALAAAVLAVLVVLVAGRLDRDMAWVVAAGLFGTSLALLQARAAGTRGGAVWVWVLVGTLGWSVAAPVGGFAGWIALGAVYGAITAPALGKIVPR